MRRERLSPGLPGEVALGAALRVFAPNKDQMVLASR